MQTDPSEISNSMNHETGMPAENALAIYELLEEAGISTWVDGGWGIDALLGEQTRPHADLDIAVSHNDVEKLRDLLSQRGYREQRRQDSRPYNFVLSDQAGHLVDVHSFTFDDAGKNVYGIAYPKESLTGTGNIDGHEVNCIALEWVVKFHGNYQPDGGDIEDMLALKNKFGIELAPNYPE